MHVIFGYLFVNSTREGSMWHKLQSLLQDALMGLLCFYPYRSSKILKGGRRKGGSNTRPLTHTHTPHFAPFCSTVSSIFFSGLYTSLVQMDHFEEELKVWNEL